MGGNDDSAQGTRFVSCREPYRPYRLPWLTAAVALYVVVYWFFAVLVQNVDLLGPVTWIEYLNGLFLVQLLPEPTSPILRLVLNLLNPLVLLHVIGPLLVGKILADRTAADFLQQFHGFATRQHAANFLSRLRTAERSGPPGVEAGGQKASRLSGSLPSLIMMAVVVFFGMLAVFVVIVEIAQPPVTSTLQRYYILLIVFLVLLWLVLIALALAITRDYLREQAQGAGFSARLAGQKLLVYGLIAVLMVAFPAFWMGMIYLLLRSGLASARLLFIVLMFAFLATTLTALILLVLAPKRFPPLKVTREELENLRAEHAILRVGGPGVIHIAESNQVAITETNGRFCRVVGPGVRRLGAFECVHSLLDLRQQERVGKGRYVTRDGLKVELSVAVTFRVASNDAAVTEPLLTNLDTAAREMYTRPTTAALFPYGTEAVQMAAYSKTVLNDDGTKVSEWQQLPLVMAQGQLRKIITELRYDELFEPDQPDQQPHPDLVTGVLEATRAALRAGRTGIHLLSVRLGPVIALDPEMTSEHISTWRAFWAKQDRMRAAHSEAQAITEVAGARREAEQMIVSAIVDGINDAQREYGSEMTRRIVALRVVETLGRLASRSQQFGAPVSMALVQQLSELEDALAADTVARGSEADPLQPALDEPGQA